MDYEFSFLHIPTECRFTIIRFFFVRTVIYMIYVIEYDGTNQQTIKCIFANCSKREMMFKRIVFILVCFLPLLGLSAQSTLAVSGGLNQPIFYCSQTNREYNHSFQPYNAYLVNLSYKQDLSSLQNNLQLGVQLEFKQQSSGFYYRDEFPTDTFATGLRYDIQSINLCLFPELRVGDEIKFVFSGGPLIQFITNTKAKGTQLQIITGSPNIETSIDEGSSQRISGIVVGAKINLGIEIPLYKDLYFTFYNAYSAGFNSMQGSIKPQMKYFNCLDINIMGGFLYRIGRKEK
ncbi:MAG: outer membrane beta-barrel protein [Lentimicrobiaceae bacterium]|nr:outer membrane beta-barrel protein [Lentimicrobiaceae bacterium]